MKTLTLDADVVCDADPQTPEWYAERRCGLTATDIPKILGLSQYGNTLSVFHDKLGNLPPEEGGPAARWGNLLEDVIAQAWAEDHNTTVRRIGVVANREHPWRRAALDRLVMECPDDPDATCGLEIKNRSAFKAGAWQEEIPDDVLVQVAWQRIVTGLDHIHVAVLIGGNDLRPFRYDRDDVVEAWLIEEAEKAWQGIQDGSPPIVDATNMLLDLLDRLYPDRSGSTPMARAEYAALKADLEAAHEVEKTAKGGKDWAKYRMVAALGAGNRLVADDDPDQLLATYTPDMRETVDTALLKAKFPDAFKACVTKKPTSPILRPKNLKETT